MSWVKSETFRDKRWLKAVSELPCALCGREGMTQAAHRNEMKGMGLKTDDSAVAALCFVCHTELDNGRDMTRDKRRSEMDRAIVHTLIALTRAGVVGIVK